MWQPVYLFGKVVADVLSEQPSRLVDACGALTEVQEHIGVVLFRIEGLVDALERRL